MVRNLSCLSSYNKFVGTASENYQPKQDEKTVKFNSRIQAVSQLMPQSRKLANCCNYLNAGYYLYAAGNGIRLVNELGPDWQDVKDVFSSKKHDHKWQKPFKFLEGTLIGKTFIGNKLRNYDITLFELPIVQKILKKIGMTEFDINRQYFIKIEGSWISKISGYSASRFPLLGFLFFNIIKSDDLIKAENNKDRFKEIGKNLIFTTCVMSVSALTGSMGRYHSRLGDLLGIGVGFVLGSKLGDYINKKLFTSQKTL